MMRRVLSSVLVLAFAGCSKDEPDSKGSADALPLVTPFVVAGTPASTLKGDDVRAALNGESALQKLVVDALLAPPLRTSGLSRLANGIDACVAQKLRTLPVSVTSENVRIEYDLDLTALCDELPKTNETVTEITNRASGTIVIGCVGGDFLRFADKTLGEVRDAGGACGAAPLIHYVAEMRYAARKVVKTAGEGGTFTEVATSEEGHFMWSGADGTLCAIERDPVEKKLMVVRPCRLALTTKTFAGLKASESLPPTDVNGPKVLAIETSLGALTYEANSPYYGGGIATFSINGWNGTLNYTNGWAPPRWDAKDSVTGAGATGTLGQAGLREPPRESVPVPDDGGELGDFD